MKITTVGNSAGIVLPKEMLEQMNCGKGDRLYAVKTANGYEISPYDPQFARQMDIAEKVMREDRDILKKLAK